MTDRLSTHITRAGAKLCVLVFASAAQAVTLGPPVATCALAAELGAHLAKVAPYPARDDCPAISFAHLPGRVGGLTQAGAFDPATGAITLAPDLNLTEAYGQSFLLHELVHAAQWQTGRHLEAQCIGELEAEAYVIQADFLRRAGYTREAALMRVMASFAAVCPGATGQYD